MKTKEEVLEEILTINIGSAHRDRRDRMLAILAEFERECVKRGVNAGVVAAARSFSEKLDVVRLKINQEIEELSKLKAE